MIPGVWDWAEWVFLYVPLYILIAAFLGQKGYDLGRDMCRQTDHYGCEHFFWYVIGALWPLALALTLVAAPIVGVIYSGKQLASSPARRRDRHGEITQAVKEARERRREIAIRDLERETATGQACKYCNREVYRSTSSGASVWRTLRDNSVSCENYRNPTSTHQVPDELDV